MEGFWSKDAFERIHLKRIELNYYCKKLINESHVQTYQIAIPNKGEATPLYKAEAYKLNMKVLIFDIELYSFML